MQLGDMPFHLLFDPQNGRCPARESTQRRLSQVKHIFSDVDAAEQAVQNGDPLVYEFYELPMPHHDGDLAFGTSIIYPGAVGGEYFMTKGHFHAVLNTAEVYYCLNGSGMLMMEDPAGQWACEPLVPGQAVYVPKGFAHRSINTGGETLVTFFCFRADAGHDYKTIEENGFRHLVVEQNGRPVTVKNPKWKSQ